MCMFVCEHICACVSVCMYGMYVSVCECIRACVSVFMFVCVCVCIQVKELSSFLLLCGSQGSNPGCQAW